MNNKIRWLALPLIALTFAACGSSDGDSDESSSNGSQAASGQAAPDSFGELSRDELIAQADKICEDTGAEILALPKPKTLPEIKQYTKDAAKTTDEAVAKLRELTPDDSTKADFEAFISIAGTVTEQSRKAADAARRQDPAELQEAIADVVKQGAESRRLSQKIGFKKCGVNALTGLPGGASRAGGASGVPEAPVAP